MIRTQPYVMTTDKPAEFNKHLSMCAASGALSDDSVYQLADVAQQETIRLHMSLEQKLNELQEAVEAVAANSEEIKASVAQYYNDERDAVLAGIDTAKENIVPAFNATRDALNETAENVYFGL